MINIYEYLKNNTYPGRGIITGKTKGKSLLAYFIMGRSENSRNRVFAKDGDTLYTKAYDESKVKDPSLIIYNCLRNYKGKTILTNGNQTDTVYDFLSEGRSFKEALKTREYEPDEPNFTPRISALINEDGSYELAILKKKGDECERLFWEYEGEDDRGHFISTYDHDGNPLPSFSHEPLEFKVEDDFDEFAAKLWNSLNEDNRISLYVRCCEGDYYEDIIINKHGE